MTEIIDLNKNTFPIDFSELSSIDKPGYGLQALIRLIGQRLNYEVNWSGEGPDSGVDLIFKIEKEQLLNKRHCQKWLVSCKDNNQSQKSVAEKDIGNITDKLHQNDCQGFLFVATTSITSGLKKLLDDIDSQNKYQTKVWDKHELQEILFREEIKDLIPIYFPNSYRNYKFSNLNLNTLRNQIIDRLKSKVILSSKSKYSKICMTNF